MGKGLEWVFEEMWIWVIRGLWRRGDGKWKGERDGFRVLERERF